MNRDFDVPPTAKPASIGSEQRRNCSPPKGGKHVDLGSLIRIVMRRFYVALPVLLLLSAGAYAAASSVDPDYESTGALIFLGPGLEEVEFADGATALEPVNPFLNSAGSIGQLSEAIGLGLQSQRIRSEFAARGLEPGFEVGSDDRSPIMQFRVKSSDYEVTAQTLEALMVWVEDDLATRQAGFNLSPEDVISTQRVSEGNEPTEGFTDRRRAEVLLFGAAILLTLVITVLADMLLTRRHQRRERRRRLEALKRSEPSQDDERDAGRPDAPWDDPAPQDEPVASAV